MLAIGMLALSCVWLALNWNRLNKPAVDGPGPDGAEACGGCGYDVRGGLLRCPECGRPTPADRRRRLERLRERWPTEHLAPRVPSPDEHPVVILTTDAGPAVDLLREHLQARGITARAARPQQIGYAAYQPVYGSHKLVVWSEDADRARAIVAALWDDDEDATRTRQEPSPE